jgi:prepilin-type N-terminal cleavage/methylation domain-containing protein
MMGESAQMPSDKEGGFTLIELMITVAIIGILSTLAVGSTTGWRRQSQFKGFVREVYNAVNTARSHAIENSVSVRVFLMPGTGGVVNAVEVRDTTPDATVLSRYPRAGTLDSVSGIFGDGTSASIIPAGITVTGQIGTKPSGAEITITLDAEGFPVKDSLPAFVSLPFTYLGVTQTLEVTPAASMRVRR